MRKTLFLSIPMFFMVSFSFGQDITLMTYNIRMDNPKDGENAWPNRKETFVNQILFHSPDVIGIQEGLEHQVHYLETQLKNYKYVGVGRADVKENGVGEYSAIFYNVKKYKELKNGTFWLSKTPDKPSRGWDASLNRICTYILLKNKKSGNKFWVFNTHFDHKGVEARNNSSKLIIQKTKEINKNNLPLFLMGDFNLKPEDTPIQYLSKEMNDSYKITQIPPFGHEGTYNGFNVSKIPTRRIDYIFVSKNNVTIKKYGALADIKDLKYPSDHFPVIIEAELKE